MPLGPISRAKARKRYLAFNFLNAFSFVFLSGNVITLFAMSFTDSASTIGLLTMFGFATFFFLPVGRFVARGKPLVKVFGVSWILRYLGMLPSLAIPFAVQWGASWLATPLLVVSVFLFNAFRGVGLIGNNPVMAHLAEGSDRGRFLTTVEISGSISAIATTVILAVALRLFASDPVSGAWTYAALILVGIVTGIAGSLMLLGTPEPEEYRPKAHEPIVPALLAALADKSYRAFMISFALLCFVAGMGRSFMAPYAKQVYGHGDGEVIAYSVIASIAAILMGLIVRKLVDRFGSKPLYAIFTAIGLVSLLPAAISPSLPTFAAEAAFVSIFYFLVAFGFGGSDMTGKTWYFGFVKPEKTFDFAVIYFIAQGVGGSLGSMAGGWTLDAMRLSGMRADEAYRIFYTINALLSVAAIAMIARLPSLGARRVGETLGVMFRPRDLRTLGLLERLDRVDAPEDEIRLLREVGQSESGEAERDLLPYLDSPRFDVRMEALLSLEQAPNLGKAAIERLIEDVRRYRWTSAYVSARILGKKAKGAHAEAAIPALREALSSDDYMLRASAAVALARLGDSASAERIEATMVESDNPRLEIACAYALEVFGRVEALPSLLAQTKTPDRPDYVVDEFLLSAGSLLGRLDEIYPPYSQWRRSPAAAREAILESARLAANGKDLAIALESWLGEKADGRSLARLVAERETLCGRSELPLVLSDAILDPVCASYEGFRAFAAICATLD
jgi:MFS family permease